jgi:hypothetical protein
LPSEAGLADVGQLTVPPQQFVTLSVRIIVHGTPEAPFSAAVTCATNDPQRPEVTTVFEAAVKGWVFATPREINIGLMKPGQTIRRTCEIRDSGRGEPCRFGRVESPAPGQVRFTLSPTRNISTANPSSERGSELLATLDIDITAPQTAWELDDRLTVYEEGKDKPLLLIPIRARVLPKVQVTPASIILPRMVHEKADFTAECSLVSTAGLEVRVTRIDLPPEITATPVAGTAAKGSTCYRLEWRAERGPAKGQSRAATVCFRAEVDGKTEVIIVPVRCRVD